MGKEKLLLSGAIERLLMATRAAGRSGRTAQSYREKLAHLLAFLGDVEVEQITTHDLRRYIAHQFDRSTLYPDHPYKEPQEGSLSPFTVSSRARAMRRLFNWLESEGLIDTNPARKVEIPKPRRTEPKGVSKEEVLALLATCEADSVADLRDKAIICFLYDSGCRAGGLCGLTLKDLDLARGLAVVTEKGDKMRYVMFGPMTADALRAWLGVRPQGRGDCVFVGLNQKSTGGLTPGGVRQMINRRAKLAGIDRPVSVHGFRHGFARAYLMNGGDLGILAQTLGHGDVRTTIDYYGIFAVGELKQHHQKHSPMSHLFGGEEDD